jgi:choline dehydrogenase-like flavoprotein
VSIIDALALDDGTVLESDVCIVGAGAAGLTLAEALDDLSCTICVVEAGGVKPDEATQALHELENVGAPIRQGFMSRARYFGGSCNLWAGRSMRLASLDLGGRGWVADSAWPITAEELAVHYPRASAILKLPPEEQFAPAWYRTRLSEAERRLYDGDLVPTVSLWAKAPMRFGAAQRRLLARARHSNLVLHANVTGIHISDGGRMVDSVTAATLDRRRLTVRARTLVLAAGGLENARLLLVSRDRHGCGIGNGSDLVGRYFMDHPRAVFGKVRLRPGLRLPLIAGLPTRHGHVQLGIAPCEAVQRRERLLNHHVTLEPEYSPYVRDAYKTSVEVMKVLLKRGHAGRRWSLADVRRRGLDEMIQLLTPKEILPHSLYMWARRARAALPRRAGEDSRVAVYFCEQPPRPESRVTLSNERDALGVNRLILDWRIPDEVVSSMLRLQELLRIGLERRGIGELVPGEGAPRFTDASHHMGTTRMSDDSKRGVVDRDCKVHGIANLYVAGSSVFPSAGHANPTLTIVALALRLAQHLRSRLT